MNVKSPDIVWIVNKRKKSERYSPINCRTSVQQRFSLTQWKILQQNSEKHQEFGNLANDTMMQCLLDKMPQRLLNFSTSRCGA